MEFLDPHIAEYVSKYTQEESPLLKKLNRETWAKILNPQMLSGHLQGRVLSMLSQMIRPRYILEIGTYTGYSAICLSEGLQQGGELYTIDQNAELKEMAKNYFGRTEFLDAVVRSIRHIDIAPVINRYPMRIGKFSISASITSPFSNEKPI